MPDTDVATMESFATVIDLESRWKLLNDQEHKQAAVLLADATDKIRSDYPQYYGKVSLRTLTRIVCQMVKRAMLNSESSGITQSSQTVGSFTEGYTYSNPDGDLYITAAERKSLRVGVQQAFHTILQGGE